MLQQQTLHAQFNDAVIVSCAHTQTALLRQQKARWLFLNAQEDTFDVINSRKSLTTCIMKPIQRVKSPEKRYNKPTSMLSIVERNLAAKKQLGMLLSK